MDAAGLKDLIRDVPDFPKAGILFRDITPVLASPEALRASVQAMTEPLREHDVDCVLGMESRGFLFGPLMALELEASFVPLRKPGKLPHDVISESYDLEYGQDSLEMHSDAIASGQAVAIVDDLIATGGTAAAAIKLAEKAGGRVVGCSFLIELAALEGRSRLGDRPVHSVLTY
ncbi:MAG: adenine phosphoribosyltransferase [Acidobacteriota bacterium]